MQDRKKNQHLNPSGLSHLYASGMGTLFSHVFRYAMNRGATENNCLKILKDMPACWHRGLGLNLARGTSIIAGQSYLKQLIDSQTESSDSIVAKAVSPTVTAAFGTAASVAAETPFIRRSCLDKATSNWKSLCKINPALIASYSAREVAFTAAVLCGRELPEGWQKPVFAAGILTTTVAQRFVNWEATSDLFTKYKMPDMTRDGFVKTMTNVAKGGVYTHPAFQVPYPKPTLRTHLIKNLLYVMCHPTMILFRGLQMAAFKMAYELSIDNVPDAKSAIRFFKVAHTPAVSDWSDDLSVTLSCSE